jgi:hypothetical protein
MLRYAKRQDELLNASSTDSDEYAYAYESTPRPESPLLGYTSTDEDEYQYEYESTPRPESPLYVPLTDDDEDDDEDGEEDGDEETPAADAVIDDEFRSSGSPGAASPIDAWSPGGERTVLDVSVNEAEIAKSFAKDWEEIERLEQEAIRVKLGLDPEDETGGAFGGLRKWLVRLALVGAGAAILRERKDQLLPLAARAKRKWTHRKRIGAKSSVIETKAVDENVEDAVDEFEEEGEEVEDAATSEVDAADSE